MTEALEDMATGEIVKEFSISDKVPYKKQEIIYALEDALKYFPMKGEIPQRDAAIKDLVTRYFILSMRENYQEISEEILSLERSINLDLSKITISKQGPNITDTIPVFARAILDKDTKWALQREHNDRGFTTYKYELSSRVPQIPEEMRAKGREALAYCHKVYADALQTDVLGNVLLANARNHANPAQAELMVLWKPRPNDIDVRVTEVRVDKDPILALKNPVGMYLVATWEEANEEPYMHFLKNHLTAGLNRFEKIL